MSDGTEQVDGYIKQTPEDPADIVKLTYTLNGGNEKEIPIGKDGGAFDVKVPESDHMYLQHIAGKEKRYLFR